MRRRGLSGHEAKRSDAHTDKVAAVDALERFGDDSLDAEHVRALGGPVAGRSRAVLLAREHNEANALGLVLLAGVKDAHLLAVGEVLRDGTRRAGADDTVAQTRVGEGAAGHDLVIATAGAVRVEVGLGDAALCEVLCCRRRGGDVAGGGNVVRRDRVTEKEKAPRVGDGAAGGELTLDGLEEGRVVDVRRVGGPLVLRDVGGDLELVPALVALLDVTVHRRERISRDVLLDVAADLLRRWPDVLEVDVLAVLVLADNVRQEVDVRRAGQGVRNDERGRGEVVGHREGVHASLEVAVARKDSRGDDAGRLDSFADALVQLATVADARHAAVAGDREALTLEVLEETAVLEVRLDDLRAGREGRLHIRGDRQTQGLGLLGDETRGDEDGRVGRVCAGRNGSDRDDTVANRELLPVGCDLHRGSALVFRDGETLETALSGEALGKVFLLLRNKHAVVRALGAGNAGLHRGELKLEVLSVRDALGGGAEETESGQNLLRHLHLLGGTACLSHVAQGDLINGEVAAGGAVLRGHVADRRTVGEGEVSNTRAVELDELLNDAVLAEHGGKGEDEIRRRRTGGEAAGELHTNDGGEDHGAGLAEHGGFGLDTANTPAKATETVDHGRVGVSADESVGVGVAGLVINKGDAGEVLTVDLVDDTVARGNDRQALEGLAAPLEEAEALLVALELDRLVLLDGVGATGNIDLHGVVDDEIDGDEGVHAHGVALEAGDAVTHGGEVHHGGHTGEVLHEDASGAEGDLDLLGRRLPVHNVLDVLRGDAEVVAVAGDALEEDADRDRELCDVFAKLRDVENLDGLVADGHGLDEVVEGVSGHFFEK
eukprot:PhM_4_TR5182/c1_g1_i1/m.99095